MTTAARPPTGPSQKTAEGVPVSFAQFLVSLGSSALVHLGEVADPSRGSTKRNLPLACHTLNLLRTLQVKTKGNLEPDEAKLLDALIEELSAKYEAICNN